VRAPYVILAAFTFLVAIVTYFVHLPELIEKPAEDPTDGGSAWQFVHLRFGAVAIFAYVGAEVAIGSILINFLGQPSMGGLLHVAAAGYVSLYWGGAMVGRFVGAYALIYIRAERALAAVAASALILVAATIFGHGHVAMWAIVSCGLFNSVMWPCIFPLSMKGLGRFTGQGSGILVTMIVGGAVIPVVQGWLADKFGYQPSFIIVLLCYAYLIYFALNGYKVRQPPSRSLPDRSAQNFVPVG
jgi:FHS family L-fucose permease-like MFS transporter